jgi:hypothetical protein
VEVPDQFWECVTMDLITQLPLTSTGFDAIAVFVDKLSKMTHIEPCKTNIDAVEFAHLLVRAVIRLHGVPRKIISDRGSIFMGTFLNEVALRWGFRLASSTAFHPQTDGQTERMNRVVEDMIRHYVGPYHDDWDHYLPMVEFAINNAWQRSIENTPFHAVYGCHPHTPTTLRVREVLPKRVPVAQKFLQTYSDRTAHAKACMLAAQDRQKAYADKSRRAVKYSLDEYVWLSSKNVHFKRGGPVKFMPKFIGPFKIIDVIGPRDPDTGHVQMISAVKLKLPENYRLHPVFHVSLLKPFEWDGVSIVEPSPVEVDTDGTPIFEAEAIVLEESVKDRKGQVTKKFLVRWTGFSPAHDTWIKAADILHPDLLSTWEKKQAMRPLPNASRTRGRARSKRGGV